MSPVRTLSAGSSAMLVFTLPASVASLRWRLLDDEGAQLQAWTAATPTTPGELQLVVDPTLNQLSAGKPLGMRSVELEITDDQGTTTVSQEYLLRAAAPLVVNTNTFVTYPQATMIAAGYVTKQMQGWHDASRDDREAALRQAFTQIVTLAPIPELDAEDLVNTDADLLGRLRVAQVLHANHLLTTDEVAEMRERGIVSMTVGESSHFFRSADPLKGALCDAAMRALAGWVTWTPRVRR